MSAPVEEPSVCGDVCDDAYVAGSVQRESTKQGDGVGDAANQVRRRGALRPSLVPAAVKAQLEAGVLETANFMEQFAVDLERLLSCRMPELAGRINPALPLKRRLFAAALHLAGVTDPEKIWTRVASECDTLRAIGAIAIGASGTLPAQRRLILLQPFADDDHFAVREWAWIGLRESMGEALEGLLPQLRLWASSSSPSIRRFASEITRPRGVWCKHLAFARNDPRSCVALLDLLMTDAAPYVQRSVGNWLNDAMWASPQWVRYYCDDWMGRTGNAATSSICRRALRRGDCDRPTTR